MTNLATETEIKLSDGEISMTSYVTLNLKPCFMTKYLTSFFLLSYPRQEYRHYPARFEYHVKVTVR